MSRVSDGIGRVLLQVTITFVVVGTAYLLLFNPRSDPIRPLTPEQVGNNIAPIGRVSLAVPPAVTTEVPSAEPVAAPAKPSAAPIEEAAEPIANPEIDQTKSIAETEIDQPEAMSDTAANVLVPPAAPRAPSETAFDPNQVARTGAGFELKPDALGMHGVYERTPLGVTLHPGAIEPTTMSMESVNGLTGTLRLTPAGWIYLQIIPDTADIPPPEKSSLSQ